MSELSDLHNAAMDLALLGDREMANGDEAKGMEYYVSASDKEKEAAYLAERLGNPEPGLSILFRSAASLAYQCGRLREAEKLVAHALSGNPTDETAGELRDLLRLIYSSDKLADCSGTSELTYRLSVPRSEAGLFNTIVTRMGWTAENLRNVLGKIAL